MNPKCKDWSRPPGPSYNENKAVLTLFKRCIKKPCSEDK